MFSNSKWETCRRAETDSEISTLSFSSMQLSCKHCISNPECWSSTTQKLLSFPWEPVTASTCYTHPCLCNDIFLGFRHVSICLHAWPVTQWHSEFSDAEQHPLDLVTNFWIQQKAGNSVTRWESVDIEVTIRDHQVVSSQSLGVLLANSFCRSKWSGFLNINKLLLRPCMYLIVILWYM
jgi:hypothetical protein